MTNKCPYWSPIKTDGQFGQLVLSLDILQFGQRFDHIGHQGKDILQFGQRFDHIGHQGKDIF